MHNRLAFAFTIFTTLATSVSCAQLNRGAPTDTTVERSETTTKHQPKSEFTVATFNVHMESPKKLIAAIVSAPSLRLADLILLQEIEWPSGSQRSNAAAIAHALGLHHAYAPGYGLSGGGSHGIAILSRLPLSDIKVIELPHVDTVVNSARRVAIGAIVLGHNGPVRVWNVHLDNRVNPQTRADQLKPVFEAIDVESPARVLVAGDLNTSPFCWVGHLLPIPCGIQDRRLEQLAKQHGFSISTRDSGSTHKFLGMRLDAIYLRGLKATAIGVGKTEVSDHFPLWARVH